MYTIVYNGAITMNIYFFVITFYSYPCDVFQYDQWIFNWKFYEAITFGLWVDNFFQYEIQLFYLNKKVNIKIKILLELINLMEG